MMKPSCLDMEHWLCLKAKSITAVAIHYFGNDQCKHFGKGDYGSGDAFVLSFEAQIVDMSWTFITMNYG